MIALFAAAIATRIAVIAAGADARAAGALARVVDARLDEKPALTRRASAEVIASIGRRPALDPLLEKRVADPWSAATKAYYTEHPQDALAKLGEIADLYEKLGPVPVPERVRLLLWRTAVYLSLDDREHAAAEARAALEIAPDLKVDLNVFRPSVSRLVDELRPSAPSAPAAPLDPSVDRLVIAMAARASAGADDRTALDALADSLHVDALVLVATRGEPATEARSVIWWRGGPLAASQVLPSSGDSYATLAEWAATHAAAGRPAALPLAATPTELALRVGALAGTRAHSVDDGSPSSFGTIFNGAGTFARVSLVHGRLIGEAGAAWTSWRISRVRIHFNFNGSEQAIDGGESSGADAMVGFRFGAQPDRAGITLLAGGFVEQMLASDLQGPGGDLGVFPREQRTGVRVEVRGRRALLFGRTPAALSATIGVEPWSAWKESPADTSGSTPTAIPTPRWGIGGEIFVGGHWRAEVDYAGEYHAAKFHGTANIPVSPPLQSPTVSETVQTLSLSLQRSF